MTPTSPRSHNPARETADVQFPSVEKADEMILQDMIQVSLAEQKSREEQEVRENVALVYEHLAAEEIEKLVENPENVDDSSPPRHDDTSIPGTRVRAQSAKEKSRETPGIDGYSFYPSSVHLTKLTQTTRSSINDQAKPNRFKISEFLHEYRDDMGYLFAHLKKRFMSRTSSDQLADNLHDVMMEMLPSLVKEKVTEKVKKEVPVQV
ncbi:hypothetical protein Tco_0290938 [Tanacetum coccineum]